MQIKINQISLNIQKNLNLDNSLALENENLFNSIFYAGWAF